MAQRFGVAITVLFSFAAQVSEKIGSVIEKGRARVLLVPLSRWKKRPRFSA